MTASLEDRLSEAAKAKQAMLEKFRARPALDPAQVEEQKRREEARVQRQELAALMRKEKIETERAAKEERRKKAEEEAAEAAAKKQAAADLVRALRDAQERALQARQKAAAGGRKRK